MLESCRIESLACLDGPHYSSTCISHSHPKLREMIANSKKWAEARGLCQTSEVHGADEWRIPIKRDFEFTTRKREEIQHKGTYELEAGNHHQFILCMVRNIFLKVMPESLPTSYLKGPRW